MLSYQDIKTKERFNFNNTQEIDQFSDEYENPQNLIQITNPKVLIAAPIGGAKQYSINIWFEWIARQTYNNFDVCVCANGEGSAALCELLRQVEINHISETKGIIDLELRFSEKLSTIQKITYAREMIRRFARDNHYDYIFFLDTDTIPAQKNAIELLLCRNKDVVSGLYFYKGSQQPVIIDKDTHTNISMYKIKETVNNQTDIEVWGFGFGCLLLSLKAFKDNAFDYDLFGEERTDDFGYCHVLEQQGFKRYFYPFVLCKHFEDPDKKDIKKEGFHLNYIQK